MESWSLIGRIDADTTHRRSQPPAGSFRKLPVSATLFVARQLWTVDLREHERKHATLYLAIW
jgi:hypothetical protein